jgi:hypothetical protein
MVFYTTKLICTATVCLLFFVNANAQQLKHVEKEFAFRYSTPNAEGMSSIRLEALKKKLLSKGTKKLLIIRNDKIVCEAFAKGWSDATTQSGTASLAKALISGMSLNAAITDGYITADAAACL